MEHDSLDDSQITDADSEDRNGCNLAVDTLIQAPVYTQIIASAGTLPTSWASMSSLQTLFAGSNNLTGAQLAHHAAFRKGSRMLLQFISELPLTQVSCVIQLGDHQWPAGWPWDPLTTVKRHLQLCRRIAGGLVRHAKLEICVPDFKSDHRYASGA